MWNEIYHYLIFLASCSMFSLMIMETIRSVKTGKELTFVLVLSLVATCGTTIVLLVDVIKARRG